MSIVYKHWEEYWVHTHYPPFLEKPSTEVYGGTNYEPDASIGMSCFLDVVRDKFKDGFSVIDYGCGAGILSNFISARLQNFNYIGLEPSTGWGPDRIRLGSETFTDTTKVKFGYISDYEHIVRFNKVDVVILISVFTHFGMNRIYEILDDLIVVFENNPDCSIVFSCFTSDVPSLGQVDYSINSDYHSYSYIDIREIEKYCQEHNLSLRKHDIEFMAMNNWLHKIYEITWVGTKK